ncbi:MAG: type II toxin-antitoxin system RelE/ParE family toxin [Devosia sp.]
MFPLEWSPHALADLGRLHAFLARNSRRAADRAVVTIRSAIELLREFPEAGRHADDLSLDRRELVVPFGQSGYVVAYAIRSADETIEVIDIRHQSEAGY